MLFKSVLAGVAIAAPLLLAGSTEASGQLNLVKTANTGISADTLSNNIASIVRNAERAHVGSPATREGEVQTAVEDLIATAAPTPAVAKAALERLLNTCKLGERVKGGVDCPVEQPSYVALNIVLAVVDGLAHDDAGDVSTPGPSGFQSLNIPISGGGGSDYNITP